MPCCVEHNHAWSGGRDGGGSGGCTDTEMDSQSRAHTTGGGSGVRREDAANDTLERLALP